VNGLTEMLGELEVELNRTLTDRAAIGLGLATPPAIAD
jgi:hypothetical protein